MVVTDVDLAGAESCAAAIRDAGGEALALHQDVTEEARWQAVIAETVAAYGRLDVLVNNAGIAVLMPVAQMTLANWCTGRAIRWRRPALSTCSRIPGMSNP